MISIQYAQQDLPSNNNSNNYNNSHDNMDIEYTADDDYQRCSWQYNYNYEQYDNSSHNTDFHSYDQRQVQYSTIENSYLWLCSNTSDDEESDDEEFQPCTLIHRKLLRRRHVRKLQLQKQRTEKLAKAQNTAAPAKVTNSVDVVTASTAATLTATSITIRHDHHSGKEEDNDQHDDHEEEDDDEEEENDDTTVRVLFPQSPSSFTSDDSTITSATAKVSNRKQKRPSFCCYSPTPLTFFSPVKKQRKI